MKIQEIKNLKQFDIIGINLQNNNYEPLEYTIYYVLYNNKTKEKIDLVQGYYDYKKERAIFLDFTRKIITYDQALLYYDLIHKAEE